MKGNRSLNNSQLKKLADSFNKFPEIAEAVPILVNEKLEIIDGQHRFKALETLNMPINYIMIEGLSLKDVQIINSATKNWNPVDYAQSFDEMGKKNYTLYLEFKKKYKLTHSILLTYMSGMDRHKGNNTPASFNAGKFIVGDVKKAHTICKELTELISLYKKMKKRSFALAFRKVSSSPEYTHKRMLEKMKLYGEKILKDCETTEEAMRRLEKLYNFQALQDTRIKLY